MKQTLSTILPIKTSHGIGEKRILLSKSDTDTAITQIAVTKLAQGEMVELHVHETMEEYFLFRKGKAELQIGEEVFICETDDFFQIPPNVPHRLTALTDTEVLTIGCATF